ncbi:hypothetical protein M9B41_05755 [SAR86 cluster bacterium]|jgi:DNA-3-methyladenine glycosylase II|nr:hypothetical protein M9B41_05755 [SAR86 cluster bacterium]
MVNKDDAHRHIIQELTEPEEQIFRDFIKNQKPIELVIKKEMLSIFLAKNIIGQQLSTKAANSIWRKIKKKILEYNTKKINQLSLESFLRSNGVSSKKAQYISGIIFSSDFKHFRRYYMKYSEEDFEELLMSRKGIGIWTFGMTKIFFMGNQDQILINDLGVQKAYKKINTGKNISKWSEKFKPYRSYLCIYLWKFLDFKV